MNKINNWFLLDSEFGDDDITSDCGNYNGSGCCEGFGNGSGDTNGKIIGYTVFHLHNFDDDPTCGIRNGSGVGYGFGDSRGCSDGHGY